MNNKHQLHNLIILDESGSMESIRKMIIRGFNELVQTVRGIEKQFPDQEHFISLVSFNGLGNKILHFVESVSNLETIDATKYRPNSMTPLLDAMGFSITLLKQALENKNDYNVLVTVMTDGEENASVEYSGYAIRKMIEELKQQRWTFSYIGADHDIEKAAMAVSIDNTMKFDKNASGINYMFSEERAARIRYSSKIRNNEDTCNDFYDKKGRK